MERTPAAHPPDKRETIAAGFGIDLLIAGAAIVAIWTVALYQTSFDRQQAIEQVGRTNGNLALALEAQTSRTILAADQVARFVRYEYLAQGPKFDMAKLIREGGLEVSELSQVRVLDAHGDPVAFKTPLSGGNAADRDYFRIHLQPGRGDRIAVSAPIVGRASGIASVQVTRPILGGGGDFAGVVAAAIPITRFTSLYERAELGPQDVISLVSLEGPTIARRLGPTTSYGQDLNGSRVLVEQRLHPDGTFVGPGFIDGVQKIFTYRTLPDFGLVIIVGSALEDALKAARARARLILAGAAGATALVLAILVTTGIARRRQRRLVDALDMRERRFREVFEYSSEAILALDAMGDGTIRVIDANVAAAEIPAVLSSADPQGNALVAAIRRCAAEAGPVRFEERVALARGAVVLSGTIVPVRPVGQDAWRIVVILSDQTERRRTLDSLAETSAELRSLTHRLVDMEERERQSLARELHDGIGHRISALGMYVAQSRAAVTQPVVLEYLDACAALLQEIGALARNLISELRPAELDDFGLVTAIRWRAAQIEKRAGVHFEIIAMENSGRPPETVEAVLFRVAQEAFENIAKHAAARNVFVIVNLSSSHAGMMIADDGRGFDVEGLRRSRRWGMRMVRERLESVGGSFRCCSRAGVGTRITARWTATPQDPE